MRARSPGLKGSVVAGGLAALLLALALLLSGTTPTLHASGPSPPRPMVGQAVWHGTSGPVRSLPRGPSVASQPAREVPFHAIPRPTGGRPSRSVSFLQARPTGSTMPSPTLNFEGLNNLSGVLPPDPNGDVGPDHYVQAVNATYIGVYEKESGNQIAIFLLGNLWPSGDPCHANDGDPIVLYDQLADRWLLSQFALPNYPKGPFYQCLAVSQTPDPTGSWYLYTFRVHDTKMNDYPKLSIWPDAYYMTANQFENGAWAGAGVWAFERERMLQGQAAQMVYFDLYDVNPNFGGMLPADPDGALAPPSGAPGLFVEWDDADWVGPVDAVRLWEFHVDWATPSNATFGVNGNPNALIRTADVDPNLCDYANNCIPQPGGYALDAISNQLMYRVQYRNFGTYQTLVANHTVDVDGNDHAGIHWFELRDEGSGWSLYQEGVYAPDQHHRWMGSIAMDHVGNIALGYSVSSSSLYPSIRYAGRLAGDPLGQLTQGEAEIISGGGYQAHSSGRWGDYSMMAVDPEDDCTFWYTQEYYATTSTAGWRTRVAAFRFPNCSGEPSGTLQGIVYDSSGSPTTDPIVGAKVSATSSVSQTYWTISGGDGGYSLFLPTGTYTVAAMAYGYLPTSFYLF